MLNETEDSKMKAAKPLTAPKSILKPEVVLLNGLSPIGKSWGLTRNIPSPNLYVKMLPEYQGWIFTEEEALKLKGQWRGVFPKSEQPMDLEIGCGNGFFFAHQLRNEPARNLLGIELKYKPLVQTVRRARNAQSENGRGIRYHARYVDRIFAENELNNVFIYFPDPWPKKRQNKNRLLRADFFEMLSKLQKPATYVDFKTDSEEYFDFVFAELKKTQRYEVSRYHRDLHKSEWFSENFMTSFEKIFIKKGQPIFYMRLNNRK